MKALILYSSGYGATQEIANNIGSVLQEDSEIQVQVSSIDDVDTIDDFDAVVVGSSVRAEHPTANVMDFLALHRFQLEQKKIAFFLVCLMANNQDGRDKVKNEYMPYILDRYPNLHPLSVEAFGGKIDFDRLNPVMQMLMERVLAKTGIPTIGSVDTRDWAFIKSWALQLKEKLSAH
jgi:menaquinone-dependent protoporphyrinogen oxidase